VAALLEEAEEDLLAFYSFPVDHWAKLRSTNPLERVNREIGRRTDVVGIFPNDRSLIRLAASVVIEQNDEWLVGRRYLSAHSLEAVIPPRKRKSKRRCENSPRPEQPKIVPTSYTTSWDLTRPARAHRRDAVRAIAQLRASQWVWRPLGMLMGCTRHRRLIPHVPVGLVRHHDRCEDGRGQPGDNEDRRKRPHRPTPTEAEGDECAGDDCVVDQRADRPRPPPRVTEHRDHVALAPWPSCRASSDERPPSPLTG
jgi:Transposase, Mutator family